MGQTPRSARFRKLEWFVVRAIALCFGVASVSSAAWAGDSLVRLERLEGEGIRSRMARKPLNVREHARPARERFTSDHLWSRFEENFAPRQLAGRWAIHHGQLCIHITADDRGLDLGKTSCRFVWEKSDSHDIVMRGAWRGVRTSFVEYPVPRAGRR